MFLVFQNRTIGCLVEVFFISVEDLFELNYLLGLLNRQNIKHELFAFPCHCGSLLLQCIVYQWFGSSPIHSYC
jgi:hypothetical protein